MKHRLWNRAGSDPIAMPTYSSRDVQPPEILYPPLQTFPVQYYSGVSQSGSGSLQNKRMKWIGIIMFTVLMIFPFVVQYLPTVIREYLSASLR